MQTTTRRTILATSAAFVAAAVVTSGIWYVASRDASPTPTTPPAATAAPTAPPTATPGPSQATMVVKVFFHKGEDADPAVVVARDRTVPRSPKVATAALGQLLAGPTRAENRAGYWSFFSAETAGMLRSVRVADGTGYADFRDFSRIIPNASSSAGSAALLAELDATLRQFGNVQSTVYSFDGDEAAFYEWLQLPPPDELELTAAAVAVARDFAVRVVGLADPVTGMVRSVGTTAVVGFHPPDVDGIPLTGSTTVISLRRTSSGWQVVAADTDTITVSTPTAGQRISSPLTVRGTAVAFEGHVQVRVLRVTDATVTNLGAGFVIGGGDVSRAFAGTIRFTAGSARSGWIVFAERSERDGSVLRATALPVRFAT